MKRQSVLMLAVICSACFDYEDRANEVDPSLSARIELEGYEEARSNGVDTVAIYVSFPMGTDSSLTQALFKVDNGIFLDNKQQEFRSGIARARRGDARKRVSAMYQTSTSGKSVNLRIEGTGVLWFRDTVLTFDPSLPSSIRVEPDKFALQATYRDEILLTAYLKASPGLPTAGTKVVFTVADSINSQDNERHFRSVKTTNSNGEASAIFSAGDLNGYRGRVPVVATTTGAGGIQITDTYYLELVDPVD